MVVLRHAQQFLLLKRSKPPFVGHYLPVGGKLEPHEDPRTAALRETWEETGIRLGNYEIGKSGAVEASGLKFGGMLIETSPTDYNWISSIYLADIDFREPPFCNEGLLEWIAFDNIPNIPTPPTDLIIYQYLMRRQPFVFNARYDADLNLVQMIEEIVGETVR